MKTLKSKKLIVAITSIFAGIVIALAAVFGGMDINTSLKLIGEIAGSAVIVISAVTHIITQGKIDANEVAAAITATQNAVSEIKQTIGAAKDNAGQVQPDTSVTGNV